MWPFWNFLSGWWWKFSWHLMNCMYSVDAPVAINVFGVDECILNCFHFSMLQLRKTMKSTWHTRTLCVTTWNLLMRRTIQNLLILLLRLRILPKMGKQKFFKFLGACFGIIVLVINYDMKHWMMKYCNMVLWAEWKFP